MNRRSLCLGLLASTAALSLPRAIARPKCIVIVDSFGDLFASEFVNPMHLTDDVHRIIGEHVARVLTDIVPFPPDVQIAHVGVAAQAADLQERFAVYCS